MGVRAAEPLLGAVRGGGGRGGGAAPDVLAAVHRQPRLGLLRHAPPRARALRRRRRPRRGDYVRGACVREPCVAFGRVWVRARVIHPELGLRLGLSILG